MIDSAIRVLLTIDPRLAIDFRNVYGGCGQCLSTLDSAVTVCVCVATSRRIWSRSESQKIKTPKRIWRHPPKALCFHRMFLLAYLQ
eukprot:3935649-Amphidinium_carterae.1